MHEFGHGSHKG